MSVYYNSFQISTKKQIDLSNITLKLKTVLLKSEIKNGILNVFIKHTTAGLLINEDEPRLIDDIKNSLKSIVSWEEGYSHNQIDNNAPSHLVATYLGCSLGIPIVKGSLSLGVWQSVFFVELDGPRTRTVDIMITGE